MIKLKPLTALDTVLVQQSLDEVTARVQEDNPHLDLRRGVFADLLLYYNAMLGAQRRQNVNDYLRARSLKALTADPAAADPDLVDDVLSNFRVVRKPGSAAQGEVTVVVSDDVTVTIAKGSAWQAKGQQFFAAETFTAKLEQAQVNAPGDRLLTRVPDGWAFTITLVAAEDGPQGNVPKDTLVAPTAVPPNYVTSYAASDFTGGTLAESNVDLLTRLQQGVACKAPSNRVNMAAMLREIDAFSRVVHMSIIGMGDPEMLRDRHWVFPVSGGGRVDWYVRTQERIFHKLLTKEATLVEKGDDGSGVWQVAITRDEAPALYEVANIRPAGATAFQGGYAVVDDVRGVDLSGAGFVPDVDPDSVEGVYSRFQTVTVQFRDTDTDVGPLGLHSKRSYDLEARCLPLVADLQDTVSSRDVRSCAADVLVKAPVPCFLQLNFTVHKRAGDDSPDLDAIKNALADAVNNLGFVGRLYASQLQDVAYAFLRGGQTASAIDMFGRIRYPDGSFTYLRDSEVLVVPDEPAKLVTPRTVQFFASPADIGITVVSGALRGD